MDYIAKNVDLNNRTFDLYTPEGRLTVKMAIDGLHNVYNVTGVIIAAHEFLKLPYDKILEPISTFTGVEGRMEKVDTIDGKTVFVDYAHNPAGVKTVLKEFQKLFGEFTTVITISSESGYSSDLDIFNSVLKFSRFVVPASPVSRKALNLDCEMIVAIGEAATKFKSVIHDFKE